MADFVWPDDLVPFEMAFYLQPHTGGTESPFSRVGKFYGLSAPRWVCAMSFRGGYWGTRNQEAFGPRLDAMLDKLEGRLNRVEIYDFRRPRLRGGPLPSTVSNLSASAGATTLTITGLQPGRKVYAGDYFGGDGRPHRIAETVAANTSGQAVVTFKPPLKATIGAGVATFGNPTGMFRLTNDDAGQNGVAVGEAQVMSLEFVEDLGA